MTWRLHRDEQMVAPIVAVLNNQRVLTQAWRDLTPISRRALEARVRSGVPAPARTAAALVRHGLLDEDGKPTDVGAELVEHAQFMRGHGYWQAS